MDFNSTETLILGGTGLIGSACRRKYPQAKSPSRNELDLLDASQVLAYFKKHRPKRVILAAGKVGGIGYNRKYPADFLIENLKIQINVFESSQAVNTERVVFFGSSCVYPKAAPQPMKESLLLAGTPEITSLSYSIAKIAGIQMARAFNEQFHSSRFVVLIPNTIYGPNDDFNEETGHVISSMIAKFHRAKIEHLDTVHLWGTGMPRREFIYVDDVVKAIDLIFRHPSPPIPLNVGSGYEISMKDLANLIAATVGFEGKCIWDATKPDGSMQKLLDSSLFFSLGFRVSVPLKEGLDLAYKFYTQRELVTR